MKISVLGIGTELTSGQILNKNGQWISHQVRHFGVPTSMHLVVPDEHQLILEALEFCSKHSDVLFVTGGLGPTSDDFTRDVIAQWTGKKLVWDETSWKHLSNRLESRGYAVREIQKQQCYFPEGSEVLINRDGTANAFTLTHQGKEVFILPGPPREIETVWKDHIDSRMREKTKNVDALITRSWDTIGFGESEIADRVESVLQNCSFEKGYRVHLPYVEFKITYMKSQEKEAAKWLPLIEQAIGPMTVLRDDQDAAVGLAAFLNRYERVVILDELPGSFLINRLFPASKTLLKEKKLSFSTSSIKMNLDSRTLILHLREESPGVARASYSYRGQTRIQNFLSPYKSLLLKEREPQFYAEMAMVFWMKEASDEPGISSSATSAHP